MGKDVIEEFIPNKNGVRIKKCCASCATHEPYDSDGPRRLCTYKKCNKVVRKNDCCHNWTMSEAIAGIKINGHGL